MSDYLDPNNEELLKDFFMEAQLQVDTLEQNILVLENDTGNRDAIDEIFRAAHTLKGAAATVQMTEISGFTHLVEDLLDEIRSGNVAVNGDVVDLLLRSIDISKEMLEARAAGAIFDEDISDAQEALKQMRSSAKSGTPVESVSSPAPAAAPAVSSASGSSSVSEYDLLELKEASGGKPLFDVQVNFDEDNPMNTVGGIQVFAALKSVGVVLKTEPEFEKLYEDLFHPEVHYFLASDKDMGFIQRKLDMPDVISESFVKPMDHSGSAEAKAVQESPVEQAPSEIEESAIPEPVSASKEVAPSAKPEGVRDRGEKAEKEVRKAAASGSVLRVDSRRIDNLLNLVSEAVINKATFNQISTQFTDVQTELQSSQNQYKDLLKELMDSIPDYVENINHGSVTMKQMKKEISEKFGSLYTVFDSFEGHLKGTVGKFRTNSQNLARTTGDLQEGVMQIRMVPISQIFSRFPRLVRDVSKSLDKKINLIIEGQDTELDKSVIEDLLDPLIHCVRNSVDHGIESRADRIAAGKPEEATVTLRARNEGNMIIIEIIDDGAGIDVNRVREKAIDRGIIHPSKSISDVEAFNLIFEPGFSTAKKVTNISGRGVGLDVVRKQIEKLNGNVSVWSEKGEGSRFTIKLPLTLAIIQGLLVRVGGEIYAIPITSVVDSHRVKPSEIKMIDNYEVFNVRDDVISLIRLNQLFRIPSEEESEYHFIVIVGSGDKKMGLMVDSLIGEEDVVIKPLKDRYTNSPGIAGATILGDGTVSLIIDVSQLLDLGLKREMEIRKQREASII